MPLLNGKFVDPKEIDPSKHKFIGSFRSPEPPSTIFNDPKTGEQKIADVIKCSCGHDLWTRESVRDHWQMGHFDIPQYVDINS